MKTSGIGYVFENIIQAVAMKTSHVCHTQLLNQIRDLLENITDRGGGGTHISPFDRDGTHILPTF